MVIYDFFIIWPVFAEETVAGRLIRLILASGREQRPTSSHTFDKSELLQNNLSVKHFYLEAPEQVDLMLQAPSHLYFLVKEFDSSQFKITPL